MLSAKEKINRYELIEQALCNRLEKLRKSLAFDYLCEEDDLSADDWETCVADKVKQPLEDLFGEEDVAYYLFDKMIEEQTGIISFPSNNVLRILEKEQTGVCSVLPKYH